MTMSDRIVVMNDGEFEQVGEPDEVYDDPASLFVADFIGKANVFRGRVVDRQDGTVTVDAGDTTVHGTVDEAIDPGTGVGVVVRPEAVDIARADGDVDADNVVEGRVGLVQRLGGVIEFRVEAGDRELLVTTPATATEGTRPARGDRVRLSFSASACRVLTAESIADDERVAAPDPVEA